MVFTTTSLVLIGAALHSTWNLLVRSRQTSIDTMWSSLLLPSLLGALILYIEWLQGAVTLTAVGFGWASLSAFIHVIYFTFVTYAYRHGEASVIYPMTRGVGLLLATLAGYFIFIEQIDTLRLVGIITVLCALVSLALREIRRLSSLRDFLSATALGSCVGLAVVADMFGVREVGTFQYVAMLFFLVELFFIPVLALRSGVLWASIKHLEIIKDLPFGLLILCSYLSILMALQIGELHYVAALREISVVIVVIAGLRGLRESSDWQKMLSIGIMLGGLILIHIG